ncbi:hypothetical protein EJ110_NYTH46251 [Nymphaea thermarum]|nr:hypothetical protein EJ110_NYTH46251 [Nymphaea thermarum]
MISKTEMHRPSIREVVQGRRKASRERRRRTPVEEFAPPAVLTAAVLRPSLRPFLIAFGRGAKPKPSAIVQLVKPGPAQPGPARQYKWVGPGPGLQARRAGPGRLLAGRAGPARPDTHPYDWLRSRLVLPKRGLRQGCPLSPLLFNLVAESFSALFHHATVVGFLTPHSLPHLPSFSTLQYADDFLLFGGASRQQIVRTWLILRVFELISGLSINSAKCHLSLIHADPATVLLAEACFGCKATSLPMDYLGLQITLLPPTPSFWDGLEQKLIDRLQGWQRKLLSLPGRITLARHCLASVPLHALSVFRPPVAVLRSLPNPPSIRLLFLFCPSPRLTASWGHVWRPWLISAWWRIWVERNNRVFRGTFSSPDSVARLVQGDVQFATRLKRRCTSAVG